MSLAIVFSRAQTGIDAPLVTIEVHLSRGLPSLSIVGLAETAVKESKDRVRSTILNNRFEFPLRRITINLAPADLPKEGGRFDLPIALGILAASGQIPADQLHRYEFVGELSLTGELRPIHGALPVSRSVRCSKRALCLPVENADEAALVDETTILPAQHILDICAHLVGTQLLTRHKAKKICSYKCNEHDLSEVRAQQHAKRALEIAAAGGHNLLFIGGPGVGKTMLAQRLPGILPQMTDEEAMEAAAIASITYQGFQIEHWKQRAFRAPHHTASGVALVGGGSHPKPGEISMAHHGVLFLDEFAEFDRKVLEVLREPLESGHIMISRAAQQVRYPANFQLVAAMNPCPCGYLGDPGGRCHCTEEQVRRYRHKISGPLLDRIDLHIEVLNLPREILFNEKNGEEESSGDVQKRVVSARLRQQERMGKANNQLAGKEIEQFCRLDTESKYLLEQAINQLGLSARAMHRIMKVARTIADLANNDQIKLPHISEAITYRRLDKSNVI
jgi:magnesium chelatase family protein